MSVVLRPYQEKGDACILAMMRLREVVNDRGIHGI